MHAVVGNKTFGRTHNHPLLFEIVFPLQRESITTRGEGPLAEQILGEATGAGTDVGEVENLRRANRATLHSNIAISSSTRAQRNFKYEVTRVMT